MRVFHNSPNVAGETRSPSSAHSNDLGGQAPALREKNATPHRRARACPSPCVLLADCIPL